MKRADHLTSLVWFCVLWLPESLIGLSAPCVMGQVAAWPRSGPLSRRPVAGSVFCGLIGGRVPGDASSGYPVISWAVGNGRWWRGMVALVVAGGRHVPLD